MAWIYSVATRDFSKFSKKRRRKNTHPIPPNLSYPPHRVLSISPSSSFRFNITPLSTKFRISYQPLFFFFCFFSFVSATLFFLPLKVTKTHSQLLGSSRKISLFFSSFFNFIRKLLCERNVLTSFTPNRAFRNTTTQQRCGGSVCGSVFFFVLSKSNFVTLSEWMQKGRDKKKKEFYENR